MQISCNQLMSALSLALDLAERKTIQHARRTAFISLQIAACLGLDSPTRRNVFFAALLHDVGLTNAKLDYNQDTDLLREHPERGATIARKLPLDGSVAENIRYHHANWDGSGHWPIGGEGIPLGARIVYLADQVDNKYDSSKTYFSQRATLIEFVESKSKTAFDPGVVKAFLNASEPEKFWLDYFSHRLDDLLNELEPEEQSVDWVTTRQVAACFAEIIDHKSKFTLNHSRGVSRLVTGFGEFLGLPAQQLEQLTIAGLLHDLGKLAIPKEILEKPTTLSTDEFWLVKSHTYYTKQILTSIPAFADIKEWAANHHETMDGTGYPERLQSHQLSLPERMMAICDVYQALTETRPYRAPMGHEQALNVIQGMTRRGKLCPDTHQLFREYLVQSSAAIQCS